MMNLGILERDDMDPLEKKVHSKDRLGEVYRGKDRLGEVYRDTTNEKSLCYEVPTEFEDCVCTVGIYPSSKEALHNFSAHPFLFMGLEVHRSD